jgi:anti-sigma factor RsiW
MSGGCLGEVAAALVDGELDHPARERAQRHLAHCATCRSEVDAQRRLKAALSGLTPAAAPDALTARLLDLQAPGTDRLRAAPVPVRPVSVRAPAGPGNTRPRRRGVRRRTAVGSAFVALGVVAIALGSPSSSATTPVDPATDSFVVQHVDTTSEVPRVVRAGLTGGGARSSR